MFEVHVDVRGLVPLPADKALEEHIRAIGVHGRNAEAIADGRVGCRASPLAKDAAGASEFHQVPDRQEERLVAQIRDQFQLLGKQRRHLLRHAGRITFLRSVPGQMSQMLRRRLTGRTQFLGIVVAKLVERESALFRQLQAGCDCLRATPKQLRHFRGRLQVTFTVGKAPLA